jgi:chromosome partitioning protein
VAAGLQPEIAVELFSSVKADVSGSDGYDLLVFDGPAKADSATLELARISDLVVQPVGASKDDLRPAVRTFNALTKAGIPNGRLLLVLARISTEAEAMAARVFLQEAGYNVADGYIPERAAYRSAQDTGRAITEVRYPTLRATAESVVQSVIDAAVSSAKTREVA